MPTSPRLATRAVIVHQNRLLLVNAWPDGQSALWCAPGGGVEPGSSLPDNLIREVHEETGLTVSVGDPCLVNEYHDPDTGFHQVEIFFRATITAGEIDNTWQDPEGIVQQRRFFSREELDQIWLKPDSLRSLPWQDGLLYDPMERLAK
ncbi:MAG: NUDIX hydrolase [Pelagimonas sp.]|jgi:ADP-ribose pyrophosphatase YjhB (NUDIX family)|nr:NUDIX hydrolase [Pelagimonas sp.]